MTESVKIVVDGRGAVGKTTMLNYLTEHRFIPARVTLGLKMFMKQYQILNQEVTTIIWDLGGLRSFDSLRDLYYQGATCLVLVYDITRYNSFEELDYFIDLAAEHNISTDKIILMGCKYDLASDEQAISQITIEEFMAYHNITIEIKSSARRGRNIDSTFELATAMGLPQNNLFNVHEISQLKEGLIEEIEHIDIGNLSPEIQELQRRVHQERLERKKLIYGTKENVITAIAHCGLVVLLALMRAKILMKTYNEFGRAPIFNFIVVIVLKI